MKRARQSLKRSLRNNSVLSKLKTLAKKVDAAISAGIREDAEKALRQAIKAFDMAASKGVIHRNTASRKISRLTKKVNAISGGATA